MKKALSLILIAVLLAVPTILPAAGASADQIKYEKKAVTAYLFDEDDPVELTCLFRSDLPSVPYISAEDFLNQLFTEKVSVTHSGDVFTITNGGCDMVIDAKKDTVHFDRCEEFCTVNAKPYLDEELAEYLGGTDESGIVGEYKPADLDLGKYNIDITASGGKVYFPYCTLNDMFADNYRLAVYENKELRFYESMSDEFLNESHSDGAEDRDEPFAEFVYHELCFTVDNIYGMPSMAKIAQSISENGFDKTLETYNATTAEARELLRSGKTADFCLGLILLDTYFYDGGHTNLSTGYQEEMLSGNFSDYEDLLIGLIADGADIDYEELLAAQTNQIAEVLNAESCKSEKSSAYEELNTVNFWDDAAAYESGDTVIFDFDEFTDTVVEPFKWTLDYAAEHHAKRFIIDLSTNSGGSTSVSEYMLSIMCGVNGPRELITTTGNEFEFTEPVDKNLDGKFDEEDDKVNYDFEFAILTSKNSYSCANLMSCVAQDNGIAVIGETSGGGCCNITVHLFPDGTLYTLAGISKALRADGSDNDAGAKPYYELPGSDDNYDGFFDIDKINAAVDGFYSGSPAVTEPETDAVTEAAETEAAVLENASGTESGNDSTWIIYLWIGLIVAAIVILILFIVLNEKRKKAKKTSDQQPPAAF